MDYLKHIDGIRAIAVFAIVFFHSGFYIFEGGFVGVDVFFVISGFLITRWIVVRTDKNNFSFFEFFARRIKRLMPVLFFVKIFVVILGLLIMSPYQFFSLLDQLIYSTFFLSNIYLWKNSDYFSVNTFENPIVHTWSLSLEEQFYIFFPFFIIFFTKFFKRNFLFLSFIFLLITSLMLAQFGGNLNFSRPYVEEKLFFFNQPHFASYFMIFGRIWEFIFGSIIFLKKDKIKILIINKEYFLSILGSLFILIPIFLFDESYLFPSIYTLIPVIGTCLLIVTYQEDNFLFKILSSKYFVFTGLISYSLYLWHQPLFAFYKIYFHQNIKLEYIIFLLLFSYLLSILSYKFIEQPFRNNYKNNKRIIYAFLTFLILFFIILNYLNSENFKSSISKKYEENIPASNFNMLLDENKEIIRFKNIKLKKELKFKKDSSAKKILIIGDSMATNWIDSINNNSKLFLGKFEFEHKVLEENCLKYLMRKKNTHPTCRKDNENFLKFISQIDLNYLDHIYFISGWDKKSLPNLYYLVDFFGLNKSKLVLVGSAKFTNILRDGYNLSKEKRIVRKDLSKYFFKKIDKTNLYINQKLHDFAKENNITFFDENLIYCKNQACKIFDNKLNLYFWDTNHLTIYGSSFFGKQIYSYLIKTK